jgi:hypothetical protein
MGINAFLQRISINISAILISLLLINGFNIANAEKPPTINITLIVAPELEACKPKGYKYYSRGKESHCQKISIKDIERWQALGVTHIIRNIPPSTVSLGDSIFLMLDAYRTASKINPNDRKSIVIVFDWKTPQEVDIQFERTLLKKKGVPFPEWKWIGRLSGERRWIHHERADAFLPAYKVQWVLTANNNKWIMKMSK